MLAIFMNARLVINICWGHIIYLLYIGRLPVYYIAVGKQEAIAFPGETIQTIRIANDGPVMIMIDNKFRAATQLGWLPLQYLVIHDSKPVAFIRFDERRAVMSHNLTIRKCFEGCWKSPAWSKLPYPTILCQIVFTRVVLIVKRSEDMSCRIGQSPFQARCVIWYDLSFNNMERSDFELLLRYKRILISRRS